MTNWGKVSDWYSPNQLKELVKILEPGDLVEFYRNVLYSHWAVYVGMRYVNGRKVACVIHFASPGDTTSFDVVCRSQCCQKQEFGLGNIAMHPLVDVALESQVRVNNGNDKNEAPGTASEVLQRAELRTGYGDEEYNVFNNNCEHFAKYCRYGRKKSDQLQDAAAVAVLGGVVFMGLAAVAIFSTGSRPTENRRDS